jgi:hypothetical protein
MPSRPIARLVASSAAAFALAAVACSAGSDGTESGNADLSAASADGGSAGAGVALAKRLVGAWVAKGGSANPGDDLALTITSLLPPQIGISRDRVHKATSDLDKQEVDRQSTGVSFLSVSVDSATFEWPELVFLPTGDVQRITTYALTVVSAGGTDTLTLTPTAQRVENVSAGGDAGAVDGGTTKLGLPETFTRASSWCAKSTSAANANAKSDCTLESRTGVWHPTNMPADCKGKEDICTTCQNHECKARAVSTCELARFSCFDTIEQCEFDVGGNPAGQVAVLDTEGNPVDCKNSPSGKAVCCQDLTAKIRPTVNGLPLPEPAAPPPP